MAAGKYDFSIEQGSSFKIDFIYKDQNKTPVDLTSYCARLSWKSSKMETTVVNSVTGSTTIEVKNPGVLVNGSIVSGPNIPEGTTIVSFVSSTSIATLSQAVTLLKDDKITVDPIQYTYTSDNVDYTKYTLSVDSNGKISLIFPHNVTSGFYFKTAKYDLHLESPTVFSAGNDHYVFRILYGNISIIPAYTTATGMCP